MTEEGEQRYGTYEESPPRGGESRSSRRSQDGAEAEGSLGLRMKGTRWRAKRSCNGWPSGLAHMIAAMQGIGAGVRSVGSGSSTKGRQAARSLSRAER